MRRLFTQSCKQVIEFITRMYYSHVVRYYYCYYAIAERFRAATLLNIKEIIDRKCAK